MESKKQTRELAWERATPCCPNCDGSMIDATVTIGEITLAWPLPEPEALRPDGYGDHSMPEVNGGPVATCPQCGQQSLLSVGRRGLEFVLTLLRSNTDRQLLGETITRQAAYVDHNELMIALVEPRMPVLDVLTFTYRNHRGEVAERRVNAASVRFYHGSTEWHPEPQMFMSAMDLAKMAVRDFAAKDILHIGSAPEPNAKPSLDERVDGLTAPIAQPIIDVLAFLYRNHRGQVAERRVDMRSACFHFGKTEWHPEPQVLMSAWDLDKLSKRDFALRDILHFRPNTVDQVGLVDGLRETLAEALRGVQIAQLGLDRSSVQHAKMKQVENYLAAAIAKTDKDDARGGRK